MIGDRCYATTLVDEELWRSLAALEPAHEVAWVHGCVLEHGHRGDHRALAYRAGPLSYWLQWDEGRTPRISTTDRPDPVAREARPRGGRGTRWFNELGIPSRSAVGDRRCAGTPS